MAWFLLTSASEAFFSIFTIMLSLCWFMTISVRHVIVLLSSPSPEPSVPYHYYEPAGLDECKMYLSHERGRHGSHHRFITEKRVFANWARMFNIHFYQPDWRPAPVTKNSTDSWGSDFGMFPDSELNVLLRTNEHFNWNTLWMNVYDDVLSSGLKQEEQLSMRHLLDIIRLFWWEF